MKSKPRTLGQQIRHYRKKTGLSQSDLAAAVGVSVTAISYYEKDLREPNIEMITRIAEVLGVAVEVLLCLVSADNEPDYNMEHAMLRVYRNLNALGRNRLFEYAESLCNAPCYTDEDEE